MNKLLFDESPLVVQPSVAKAIGLHEAILLQQIHYWLKNKNSGRMIDGEKWIYNSLKEWHKQLPFISTATISRAMMNLQDAGLIKIGNFNRVGFDRTQWYTINYATVEILHALIEQEESLKNESADEDPDEPEQAFGSEKSILQNEKWNDANCKMDGNKLQHRDAQNAKSISQNETTIPETTTKISPKTNQNGGNGHFAKPLDQKAELQDCLRDLFTMPGDMSWDWLDELLLEIRDIEFLRSIAHNARGVMGQMFDSKQFVKMAHVSVQKLALKGKL